MQVKVLRHDKVLVLIQKPGHPELLVQHFKCQPHEIAVIGDRCLTDVVYGQRLGALTVLCTRVISLQHDNPMAIRVRALIVD